MDGKLDNGLLKGHGICLFMAWYNQTHKYAPLKLHVVHGSLGFGTPPFFEMGGQYNRVVADYHRGNSFNMHTWLEDAEGNVYDVVQPDWPPVAKFNQKEIYVTAWLELEKLSRKELRDMGLTYKRAPKVTNEILDGMVTKVFQGTYFKFLENGFTLSEGTQPV
jgi:hypothetical protein